MRRLVLLPAAAASLVAAAPAAAADQVIRVSGSQVTRIGAFKPKADPSIGAAAAVFGPTSSRKADGIRCIVRWDGLGLTITFADLGENPGEICDDQRAKASEFGARGTSFVTGEGLRPGMRERQVRKRHPSARKRGKSWILRRARGVEGFPITVLRATVSRGKVFALRGAIGAAGS